MIKKIIILLLGFLFISIWACEAVHAKTPTPTVTKTATEIIMGVLTPTPTPIVNIDIKICKRKNVGAVEAEIPKATDIYFKELFHKSYDGTCFIIHVILYSDKGNTLAKRNALKNALTANSIAVVTDFYFTVKQ